MLTGTIRAAVATLIAAGAFQSITGPGPATATTVNVAVSGRDFAPFCMVNRIARHPSLPQISGKYGVQTEDVTMPIPQIPVTVSNGSLPIGECTGISTAFNAWNKGAKKLMIFAFGSRLPVFQLIASRDIKSLQDVRGKIIGVQGIQTAGAEAVEMILKRGAAMLPDRDYKFITIGANSAVVAALRAGKIDVVPFYPPFTYELEKRGFAILADEVKYVPQYVTGAQIANRDWVEKNQDTFVKMLKALIEAGQWLRNPANEKEVVGWFGEHMASGTPEKLDAVSAQRAYDFYVKENRLSFDGYAPQSAVQATLDILKERGFITEAEIPPLGKVIDFSYLNLARKELGLEPVAEYARN